MSRVHMGHPSAALPQVPPGSSRQQGAQKALLCGVDKDGPRCADSGLSARGPVAHHPHLAQPLEAFPFPAIPNHLPLPGRLPPIAQQGRMPEGHRQPCSYCLGQDAGPPRFREGGQSATQGLGGTESLGATAWAL